MSRIFMYKLFICIIAKINGDDETNTKEKFDATHASFVSDVLTSLNAGTFKVFKDNFSKYGTLSDKELEETLELKEGEGPKMRKILNEHTKKADIINKRWDYAQTNLATRINSLVKNVAEDYSKNISDANSNEFTSSFETQGRVIVKESLAMINVLDKKVLLKPSNIYDFWIVIEVSKKSLLEGATKAMSTSKKLQLEADKVKFREIFENEMNKIDN